MKNRNIILIALVTAFILLIPLVAMQFTNEMNWSVGDFIVAGALLFGTGLTFELVSRRRSDITYKVAVGIAVGASLLLMWVNAAVGLIGSEANPANIMYFGVICVGIIGATAARLQPKGMANALFAMALAQIMVPVITLMFWKHLLEEPPGFAGVIMLTLFFVMLFGVSGLLFRQVSSNAQIKTGS